MAKILTSRSLNIPTKLKILKCYVFSIFTYGAEAWTLTKVLEGTIEAFEMWCLWRIGKISWKDKVSYEFGDVKEWTKRSARECKSMAVDRHLWSVTTRQPSQRR